jgi:hypothetical protein
MRSSTSSAQESVDDYGNGNNNGNSRGSSLTVIALPSSVTLSVVHRPRPTRTCDSNGNLTISDVAIAESYVWARL